MPFDNPAEKIEQLDDVTLLLIEARQKIQKGWTRGRYQSAGRFCMLGALGYNKEVGCPSGTASRANSLLESLLPPEHFLVFRFNDKQKTKKPVLELLDRAIAKSMQCE